HALTVYSSAFAPIHTSTLIRIAPAIVRRSPGLICGAIGVSALLVVRIGLGRAGSRASTRDRYRYGGRRRRLGLAGRLPVLARGLSCRKQHKPPHASQEAVEATFGNPRRRIPFTNAGRLTLWARQNDRLVRIQAGGPSLLCAQAWKRAGIRIQPVPRLECRGENVQAIDLH